MAWAHRADKPSHIPVFLTALTQEMNTQLQPEHIGQSSTQTSHHPQHWQINTHLWLEPLQWTHHLKFENSSQQCYYHALMMDSYRLHHILLTHTKTQLRMLVFPWGKYNASQRWKKTRHTSDSASFLSSNDNNNGVTAYHWHKWKSLPSKASLTVLALGRQRNGCPRITTSQ